jgi:hypothetical protein
MRISRSIVVSVAVCSFGALGACKKNEEALADTPKAAPLAMSHADPGSKALHYDIAPDGKTSIDMPAPKERIKADTTAAKGQLDVDPANLVATRGDVLIDLDTLKTHTFDDAEKNATQTEHAHTWLQVDSMVKDTASRERNRWVHFAIRSVDALSATDVTKVVPTREGSDDVRTVTLTAHGDLEVHSLPSKAQKDVPLEVRMHVPAGASPDTKPTLIDIKSKTPFQIVLADHDVKPRDGEGILAQRAFGLLGTKVADVANVSLDLEAKPAL